MDYKKLYAEKLVSAEKAASVVKSGDWVDYGWTTGTPVAVDAAIAKRLPELENVNFRGGILMWVPEIFKIENPAAHMTWNSWHMSGIERKAIAQGFSFYAPIRYSELPRYYRESATKPDVAVFQVAPMDEHGYFNFGPNASHMAACCETSKVVIVEVNENMPVCLGGFENGVHISNVDMIVEGSNPTIAEMGGAAAATDVDEAVAKLIVDEIPDGACLQLGIGGMPNAVGSLIAKSDLKDLGVHTEMYVDAFVDIAKAGKITGAHKQLDKGRQVYAFGAGTQKMYDYLNDNPECMSAPVDYTNDIRSISALDNFIGPIAQSHGKMGGVFDDHIGLRHLLHHAGLSHPPLQFLDLAFDLRVAFHLFVFFLDLLLGHFDLPFVIPPLIEDIGPSQNDIGDHNLIDHLKTLVKQMAAGTGEIGAQILGERKQCAGDKTIDQKQQQKDLQ